jgi:hypothetical protein
MSETLGKGGRAAAYLCGLGVLNHNLIPWGVVVPKERRDDQLKARFRTEASGILNWMLHGLAHYLQNGMQYPQKVEAATSQYRESQSASATETRTTATRASSRPCAVSGEPRPEMNHFTAALTRGHEE